MDLINQAVKHRTFGKGVIISQEGHYITVQFSEKVGKFLFPDVFERFLTCENSSMQSAILQHIAITNAAKEAEKATKEKTSDQTKVATLAATIEEHKIINAQAKKLEAKEPHTKTTRISGKRMTFYVFQGNTYDRESRGGYIWAPTFNKAGKTFHHWTRLLDVYPGDIILHGYNGCVQAVSTARDVCYDCPSPEELRAENMWEQEGRRVDCDYIVIQNPIKTMWYKDDILHFCKKKYAPFDKDGNGNMGYLFELNRELARIFLRASVKYNPELSHIDYINELLLEDAENMNP